MRWIEHYYNRVVKEKEIALSKLDQSVTSSTGLIGVLIPLQWFQMDYSIYIFFAEMIILTLFILKDAERYQYFMKWNRIIYAIERKRFLLEEVDYMEYIRRFDFGRKTIFPITLFYAIARRLKKVYFLLLFAIYLNSLIIEVCNVPPPFAIGKISLFAISILGGYGIILIMLFIWILSTKKLPKEFDYTPCNNDEQTSADGMKNIVKKIYYAHSMYIYNTRREKKELEFLRNEFQSVCNPNKDITWDNNTKMEPYFEAVKNSDIVVASEYKKHIGKGVFDEIMTAINNNITVLCLRRKLFKYQLYKIANVEIVNDQDWKKKYGKIILLT